MGLRLPPESQGRWLLGAALGTVLLAMGCEPAVEVRVYEAPKADTVFVAGPKSARENGTAQTGSVRGMPSTPASGPRRILGAVVPLESGCFFLKATDSPERIQPLLSDF
ncbi:MAG: hypothetical protein ACK53L_01090, partial [Pirellulaceae bacterium]